MNRSAFAAVVGLGMMFLSSTAIEAQIHNFPNYAVPSAFGAPSSLIGATYGRGLNTFSGEQNAFGIFAGRTGISDRVGVVVGGGMIDLDPDSKFAFGGAIGVDVLGAEAETQIGIQGGIGYFSPADDVSMMSFPIGVAVKGSVPGESASFGWWFMPRLDIQRASVLGFSATNTDLGASAGGSINLASGFGIHAAVDLLAASESIWFGGVGVHYTIN